MSKFQSLLKGDTPVLVDFHATWCGPCKTLAPILDRFKKKHGEGVIVIKIDVDKNKHAAEAYKVRGVPTLILYKKGKAIWRKSGVVPMAELDNALALAK